MFAYFLLYCLVLLANNVSCYMRLSRYTKLRNFMYLCIEGFDLLYCIWNCFDNVVYFCFSFYSQYVVSPLWNSNFQKESSVGVSIQIK